MFITFIFKLPNQPGQTLYGKYYTDYISDDHEGLDAEIKPFLLQGIRKYQKIEPKVEVEDVHIGIISVSDHNYISVHSTDEERNCFDFYCKKFTINYKPSLTMYMFGKLLEN
jgi:hypothetical protein